MPSIRSSDNSFDLNDNDNYVYVEQLSLVKLNLTRHYGIELEESENSVFSLNKTNFVIIGILFLFLNLLN